MEHQSIKDKVTLEIVRKIADGGMGSVYEALQHGASGFHKTVAVKTLLPEFCQFTRFVEMFMEEAKLVAGLVHENIVQIYQLGKTRREYYIVMEYIDGIVMSEFIEYHQINNKPVPIELSVFICARIARGLAYAHSRTDNAGYPLNIVHRDVCPSNVMLTREGLPKLTDFGIARARTSTYTQDGSVLMGKFTYMAPEQATRDGVVNFRTDIFALGAVFFEVLTRRKIRKVKEREDMIQEARDALVSWGHLPENLPTEVCAILERSLAHKPEERYKSATAMARDLEYFIYKDGYGPTTQTLEVYLRRNFDKLYENEMVDPDLDLDSKGPDDVPFDPAETIIMEDDLE